VLGIPLGKNGNKKSVTRGEVVYVRPAPPHGGRIAWKRNRGLKLRNFMVASRRIVAVVFAMAGRSITR